MKHLKHIFGLAVLLLCSCTERIDLRTRDGEPHLVIYGHITDAAYERNGVDISRSTGYFSDSRPEPIRDARVTVSDGERTFTLREHPSQPGFYIPGPERLDPMPGTEYTLEVEVDFDGNGEYELYRARTKTSRRAIINDVELEHSRIMGGEHVEVLLSATIPQGGEQHYCVQVWVNDGESEGSRSQMRIFDAQEFNTDELERVSIFWLDQDDEETHLEPGDEVRVALDAITGDYADFLNYAQEEMGVKIPFFSGPPANLPCNIERATPGDRTPVVGYFTSLLRDERSAVYEN